MKLDTKEIEKMAEDFVSFFHETYSNTKTLDETIKYTFIQAYKTAIWDAFISVTEEDDLQ